MPKSIYEYNYLTKSQIISPSSYFNFDPIEIFKSISPDGLLSSSSYRELLVSKFTVEVEITSAVGLDASIDITEYDYVNFTPVTFSECTRSRLTQQSINSNTVYRYSNDDSCFMYQQLSISIVPYSGSALATIKVGLLKG